MRYALLPLLALAAGSAFAADVETFPEDRRPPPDERLLLDGGAPTGARYSPPPECLRRDVDCVIDDGPPPRPRHRSNPDLPPPIFVPGADAASPSAELGNPSAGPLGGTGQSSQGTQSGGLGSAGRSGSLGGR